MGWDLLEVQKVLNSDCIVPFSKYPIDPCFHHVILCDLNILSGSNLFHIFPRGVKSLESFFLNGFDQVLTRFVAKQEEMLGVCEI